MNYEKWVEKYKPIKNRITEYGSSYNDCMFETYGEELKFVESHKTKYIWTLLDDGKNILSGYHYVNRFGYFITEIEWKEYTQVKT